MHYKLMQPAAADQKIKALMTAFQFQYQDELVETRKYLRIVFANFNDSAKKMAIQKLVTLCAKFVAERP